MVHSCGSLEWSGTELLCVCVSAVLHEMSLVYVVHVIRHFYCRFVMFITEKLSSLHGYAITGLSVARLDLLIFFVR